VTTREILDRRIRLSLDDTHTQWFTRAVELAGHGTPDQLLQSYTEASRQLGNAPLPAHPTTTYPSAPQFEGWTLEDAGRLVFLLARHEALTDAERSSAEAMACYEQGDTREQRSWLRGVAWLPDPRRYLQLVIDACRTNIVPLFEAVACDNPYPGRYFPDRNFNQLVLKALFNNVSLARIQGLAGRANAELARMAGDYAAERQAAGRTIPSDIGLAMAAPAQRTHS
jgi:hypothetical protein